MPDNIVEEAQLEYNNNLILLDKERAKIIKIKNEFEKMRIEIASRNTFLFLNYLFPLILKK